MLVCTLNLMACIGFVLEMKVDNARAATGKRISGKNVNGHVENSKRFVKPVGVPVLDPPLSKSVSCNTIITSLINLLQGAS